jgi:hypothetical protein
LKNYYKALIVPTSDVLLSKYKGYCDDNKPIHQTTERDLLMLYETLRIKPPERYSFSAQITRFALTLPLYFVWVYYIVELVFGQSREKIKNRFELLKKKWLSVFFKFNTTESRLNKAAKKRNIQLVNEDVPKLLHTCKEFHVKILIYSLEEISPDHQSKINMLIREGLIHSYHHVDKLTGLSSVIDAEEISIHNSVLAITDKKHRHDAEKLGFYSGNGNNRNVFLLGLEPDDSCDELTWNPINKFLLMERQFNYYLKARNVAFCDHETIFYIEEAYNEKINSYLLKNFEEINTKLNKKGFRLFYYPLMRYEKATNQKVIIDFLRYRQPLFYSLSDREIAEMLELFLKSATPQQFYDMLQDELQLPYFKKPCLLRLLDNKNQFTYREIEIDQNDSPGKFFDFYIEQVQLFKEGSHIYYQLEIPPEDYDADWYFNKESKEESEELKKHIDSLKAAGEYGILAEAIIYMLDNIKENNPEWLRKLAPLIQKNKLLTPQVTLSRLVVDEHFKILLPDFGNIEVKMHALPKALYLLFLSHPEGIRFKELYLHKTELLDIYNHLTNKADQTEIVRAIDDLTDMTKPSVNQKSARIREAFRKIMDEETASWYYLKGNNGEPKKIALPMHLLELGFDIGT